MRDSQASNIKPLEGCYLPRVRWWAGAWVKPISDKISESTTIAMGSLCDRGQDGVSVSVSPASIAAANFPDNDSSP